MNLQTYLNQLNLKSTISVGGERNSRVCLLTR